NGGSSAKLCRACAFLTTPVDKDGEIAPRISSFFPQEYCIFGFPKRKYKLSWGTRSTGPVVHEFSTPATHKTFARFAIDWVIFAASVIFTCLFHSVSQQLWIEGKRL